LVKKKKTMISLLALLSCVVGVVTQAADAVKSTCLVNGYDSKIQIPLGSGYSVATLKVVAADDQIYVRASALTSAVVTLQAYVFPVVLAQIPKLADGSFDLMHKSGQLIDASGGHYEIRNATDLTIFFTATCPSGGLDGFACKFVPSPLNCDVSAAVKRDGQFHVPMIFNRRTAELALKEGQFVFFYGRGDVDQQKKLYYSIKKPIYQTVGVTGFVESIVVPHFSTNPDDLPTTDSGIIGTSYDLPKDAPIIIASLSRSPALSATPSPSSLCSRSISPSAPSPPTSRSRSRSSHAPRSRATATSFRAARRHPLPPLVPRRRLRRCRRRRQTRAPTPRSCSRSASASAPHRPTSRL
jgi:hypothetical protein